jgi:protein tyrosine/serine phosphatase
VLERALSWDGCLNVRDLGGHPTEDGGETRLGAVVRADSVRLLSETGWDALVDYGVTTIVDLRTDRERAKDPPADVPVQDTHVDTIEESDEFSAEVEAAADVAPDRETATREVYLVFLERFRANFARAVVEIARAPQGVVVVHCMGGKDRTGLVTALLLRVAGVSKEDIAADYALSEELLWPRHERWLAKAETDAERERIERIIVTPAGAMVGVLDELERRYGSVEGYLRAGGAGEDDLARARRRLRA